MNDQAASLRLMRGDAVVTSRPRERAIAVTGGKGGVGKSTVAVNLAAVYAASGSRTLVVDADFGMADLNLLLGVAPARSMLDALDGMPVEDVLVSAHGIQLLPALNGSYTLATMGSGARTRALEIMDSLSTKFDTVVLDIAAGIGANQATFAAAAADALVIVNPEPLSMADAYACLKVLAIEHGRQRAYVVPNRANSKAQADEVVGQLTELVARFLDLKLIPLPAIPSDPAVTEAAHYGIPLVRHRPDSPAARAIRRLAIALDAVATPDERSGAARGFWRRQIEHVQGDTR